METELLLKCLTIICRHFENIPIIGRSDYVSNSVAIATCLIKKLEERKLTKDEQNFIETFSQFLEVIYDPYLTWRNFLKGDFADFSQIRYHATQLHVEIVPFIYGESRLLILTKFLIKFFFQTVFKLKRFTHYLKLDQI